MPPFLTVLLFIASWLISIYLLPSSLALAYGLLYVVSWILFVIVMGAREREREGRRFDEGCRRERLARARRRRQAYYSNQCTDYIRSI